MPEQPIIASNWRELIRRGELKECLDQVVAWTKQFQHFADTGDALQARYNALKKKNQDGGLSEADYREETNRIRSNLQILINEIYQSPALHQRSKTLAPISEDELGFRESLIEILPPEYSNLEVLSEGDYNVVYKATRNAGTELENDVAIKVFKNISLIQDESAKKLEHKFSLAQKYSNLDGIVTIYSSYMQLFPQFYVMRFIRGLDLDDYLEQDWPMSLHEKRRILLRIAEALRKGHQDDLLHLNLRPSNIKVDLDGDPQLLPFQIVQFNFSRRNIKRIKKLVTYWSPEQVNGGELTGRTDQFAFGLIAYELFTQKPLFIGDTVLDIMMRRFEVQQAITAFYEKGEPDILQQELEQTDCPPFFIDTIRQLLQSDPGLRFLDMDEIIDEIEDIEAKRPRVKADFKPLERSFDRCRKQEHFYFDFYQAFFKEKPAYEALFEKAFLEKENGRQKPTEITEEGTLGEQRKKMRWQFQHRMLDLAMERMLLFHEKTPEIEDRMNKLAQSHQAFGIAPEDFVVFLDCMKTALLHADADRWPNSESIDKIWADFVSPILAIMKKKT